MEHKTNSPRLRCLIVDDEESAHIALRDLIDSAPWLCFVGGCYNALEAIEMMAHQNFDIVFLDVRMPGLSGLDLLGLLSFPRPHIILTTGFREYAYDGFKHEVTDFLLKPVARHQFIKVVSKLLKKPVQAHAADFTRQPQPDVVTRPLTSQDGNEKDLTWFKVAGKNIPVRFDQIYFVQALKDYVKIHSSQGTLLVYGNLARMTKILPSEQFVRINRSYIVNRYAIREIEGNMVKMLNGFVVLIPVRSRRAELIKQLTR
ncbi:LytR/AlgR family response regulator transcription factor [Dyadobacter sp. MSC1_007]|jgi:two-component system LytT family response regulator|uniref:LytR/AlgR family response regulator transcription factor n=1 Tax=Dyadobacter sp. MSC1_007 TaxID=2909264 RepID=UPI00202E101C|nr:LytTR family DNA-binding domain-containing protein [Dyadobacter sp. MSC1_007]